MILVTPAFLKHEFRGIPKRTYTYLLSTMFAILGSGLLFIGVVIWTVIVNKAKSINNAVVGIHFTSFCSVAHTFI